MQKSKFLAVRNSSLCFLAGRAALGLALLLGVKFVKFGIGASIRTLLDAKAVFGCALLRGKWQRFRIEASRGGQTPQRGI